MASIRRRTYRTPDSKSKRSNKWSIRYRDADGIVREVPGFKDKEATRQYAAKLERDAELGRAGVRDVYAEHRTRPLSEHLADFEAFLSAKGNTPKYVRLAMYRVRELVSDCLFRYWPEIAASRVQQYLADLRTTGAGNRTTNHYLRATKQFTRWMVRDRRMPDDPLVPLEMLNVETDRRHVRRALTDTELASIIEAARMGKPIHGLSGPDRAMLYYVASFTGLRASELASLTPEDFDIDADLPAVRVKAAYSKRRREDVIPLHAALVEELRPWLALKPLKRPVWPGRWAMDSKAGHILKRDLKRAGVVYRDDAGRVADFHALRHTYITRLGRAGVSVQQAKELARHSDVNLTLGVYQHLEIRDAAAAVDSLLACRRSQRSTRSVPPGS